MNSQPCTKCKGTGKLTQFKHVDGGKCYQCNGTGEVSFIDWKSEWMYQIQGWYQTEDYRNWVQNCKKKKKAA